MIEDLDPELMSHYERDAYLKITQHEEAPDSVTFRAAVFTAVADSLQELASDMY